MKKTLSGLVVAMLLALLPVSGATAEARVDQIERVTQLNPRKIEGHYEARQGAEMNVWWESVTRSHQANEIQPATDPSCVSWGAQTQMFTGDFAVTGATTFTIDGAWICMTPFGPMNIGFDVRSYEVVGFGIIQGPDRHQYLRS